MLKSPPYDFGHQLQFWNPHMPKRANDAAPGFGARQVLQLIDAFIECGALTRKAQRKVAA